MFVYEKLSDVLTKNYMISGEDSIKAWFARIKDSLDIMTEPFPTDSIPPSQNMEGTNLPQKDSTNKDSIIKQLKISADTLKVDTAVTQNRTIVYFYKTGCPECTRIEQVFKKLSSKFGNIGIIRFDIAIPKNALFFEAMSKKYNVPENLRLITPAVFLADTFIIDVIKEKDLNKIIELKKSWELNLPEVTEMEQTQLKQTIIERFKKFSILSIIAAGLVDSINPCAFATLIFLISYLAYVEYRRKNILWCGMAFTLAVFITYLLIGIGLLKLAVRIESFVILSKILYYGIAAFAFVVGCINIYDYWLCKKGRATDMALQLPGYTKKAIHFMIRDKLSIERHPVILYATAFVVGIIISILETICTGQVYLPTINYIIGIPELKARAVFYLIIYNLLFVAPLVFIFILVYWGMSSKKLSTVMNKNLAGVKLATAIVLFALCALMIILK